MLTAQELGEYIDTRLAQSAFRLERLDRYDVAADGDDFERFMRGEVAPRPERKQPWLERLRREAEAGILNQRVHVLRTPLTDYLRYECEWGYVPNAHAGEDIRILDLAEHDLPPGVVDHDFWLVDNTHAIRMHYDDSGQFIGAEPVDDPSLYQHSRAVLVADAEPFSAWWGRHCEEWREYRVA